MLNKRSRAFLCTMNNPDCSLNDLKGRAEKAEATSFRGQPERGESGTYHYQFYLGFKNARTVLSVTKLFPKCHIEAAKDPGAAWDYCGKEESRAGDEPPQEYGPRPAARRNVKGDVAARNKAIIEKGIT